MPTIRDRAICLRKLDYSETSQILAILTREHGQHRVIAKGAHRRTKAGSSKYDGGLDVCDLGEAVFIEHSSRDLSTLTEWTLFDGQLHLRKSMRAICVAQYLCEITSFLFETADAHVELFDRLEKTLPTLVAPQLEGQFLALHLDILKESGHLPRLAYCASCGQRVVGRMFFTTSHGGVLCDQCEATVPGRVEVDPDWMQIAATVLKLPRQDHLPQDLPPLHRKQTEPLNALLSEHIQNILQRRLMTRRYIIKRR